MNARTLSWWSSQLQSQQKAAPAFVDVTELEATSAAASVEVVVRDTVRIRVTTGFDPELLRAVVSALESC